MEDFVTFEIAKKLKEKWFREPCWARYSSYGGILYNNEVETRFAQKVDYSEFFLCYNLYEDNDIDAPTISQVLKWLREEKEVYISIFIDDDSDDPVTYEIWKGTECVCSHQGEYFTLKDWSKCELKAIEYTLDNLI